ncbi:hypothetical protein SKAU_G00087530 [Synaphobranchus kaupii]|uniref:PiggyBac transposable element-derived protein domain-containing protein n=1 Tax=Synaphobranchus kaupii TaxID=118154 RepID=A0A9Q1FWW2_SYNKA|nr:hypothetical protein SKAU_G00087530 [Synaphobranchus kaupii]
MRRLLEEHHTPRRPPTGGRPAADNPLRLTARHFLSAVPQTEAQGSRTRRHCKTGFVQDIVIYTGATTDITHYDGLGLSGSVVMTMLAPHLGKGHTLFVDNWYSSPTIFHHLLTNNTGACGTVRKNRKWMPTFSGQNLTYQVYQASVMRRLLEEHHTPRRPPTGGRPAADNPLRLTARHFLSAVPQTEAQGSRTRRHCKVCLSSSMKRKQKRATKFMCAPCNTPLQHTPVRCALL